MSRKWILRYLILLMILLICAGAAWYLANLPQEPIEDAVLVENEAGRCYTGEIYAETDCERPAEMCMEILSARTEGADKFADGRCTQYVW